MKFQPEDGYGGTLGKSIDGDRILYAQRALFLCVTNSVAMATTCPLCRRLPSRGRSGIVAPVIVERAPSQPRFRY